MLKRLFGIGKKQAPSTPDAPSAALARRAAPLYDNPVAPYENYFNVHFYGASLDRVVALVREYYLQHVVRGTVGAVVVQSGGWVTAYFPEAVVKGLGFNRLASQMAETLDTWVIAYRVF